MFHILDKSAKYAHFIGHFRYFISGVYPQLKEKATAYATALSEILPLFADAYPSLMHHGDTPTHCPQSLSTSFHRPHRAAQPLPS